MEDKKAITRSPSYPSTTLQEAIDKARTVWDHVKRNAVSTDKLPGYWKYGPKSSGGRLTNAALKQFGLLEYVGSKKSGEVKLTELALKIILDSREPSPERDAAVKEAALKPAIYRELWTHWEGQLPSDDTIRTYLTLNKGFNEASVQGFITDFKKTISFAKLTPADTMSQAGGGPDDEEEGEEDDPVEQPRQHRRRPMQAGMKEDTYTLGDGQVVIQWPDSIAPEEYEDLETWLQLMIRKVKRSVREDEPPGDD